MVLKVGGLGWTMKRTNPSKYGAFERHWIGLESVPDAILAAMHAYLNDPTGIRDATISEPMFKPIGNGTRYVVCLRFNGKQDNGMYAGDKLIAAEFLAGRFDDFVDVAAAREPCAGAVLVPFPELEQLKP